MKGIILAAGRGRRMGDLTSELPKCRTKLHGKSLIDWQLEALRNSGIDDIAIVRGYLADTFDYNVQYFENSRWAETNMVMSLAASERWLQADTCLVSYSDIVYSSDTVTRLMSAKGDICITYDKNWKELWELRFDEPLSDAETFKLNNDQVIEIGNKTASYKNIEGQYMGLTRFTPTGWEKVTQLLSKINKKQQDCLDMTMLFQELIAIDTQIFAVPINDNWYEVDSESDLIKYNKLDCLF